MFDDDTFFSSTDDGGRVVGAPAPAASAEKQVCFSSDLGPSRSAAPAAAPSDAGGALKKGGSLSCMFARHAALHAALLPCRAHVTLPL